MIILGIESSCDETAASVVQGRGKKTKVLSNVISSQIDIHRKYNGVVPEIAAREHVLNIIPVINEALEKAGVSEKDIDVIAVAKGPGLVTSLMVGVETAKTLSYAWNKPLVGVNHIEGHIYSNFIEQDKIKLPAIILTVSGGHTMIVLMEKHGKYKTIGETVDDAAGEAFDKAAKLLGLGYPGGPEVSKQADVFKDNQPHLASPLKGEEDIVFPRPMLNKPNFNFSFSGLKTSLLYKTQKDKNWKKRIPEYCFKYQEAIVDVLIKKVIKASKKYEVKNIMLAGGVSANKELRESFDKICAKEKLNFIKPDLRYTTDNAVMMATAGYFKAVRKEFTPFKKLNVECNLELK